MRSKATPPPAHLRFLIGPFSIFAQNTLLKSGILQNPEVNYPGCLTTSNIFCCDFYNEHSHFLIDAITLIFLRGLFIALLKYRTGTTLSDLVESGIMTFDKIYTTLLE